LRKLTRHGLRSAKLVISTGHGGIKAAIAKMLNASCSAAACTSCATRPGCRNVARLTHRFFELDPDRA
jgi:hypothetical protein